MFIKSIKSKRNNGDPLFIFNFESEEDYLSVIKGLRKMANFFKDEDFSQLIDTLESRTDDKYSNDEVALSGMLFCSEMTRFVTYCTVLTSWIGDEMVK